MIKKGVGYVYITSDTVSEGWQLSEKDIGATDSIPGQTLSTLYNDVSKNNNVLMYDTEVFQCQ